jgi:membrane protease subunit HflK
VLAEYQKAPGVTRDRMYLDTMQQIFSSTSKVMVDAKTGSNLLYLPLDKLIALGANEAAIGAPASPAGPRCSSNQPQIAVAATPPQEAMPSMESVRSATRAREALRDRESR